MPKLRITKTAFLNDPQGVTFADVVNDPEQPFDDVIAFFDNAERQRRMEASEIHHDRPPLAGVVRELEAQPAVNQFLASADPGRSRRLRQAIGVLVRMIMEQRGWQKTGRKGSLGVRAGRGNLSLPPHNSGGLALWFIRVERYEKLNGMPYRSVRERCQDLQRLSQRKQKTKRTDG